MSNSNDVKLSSRAVWKMETENSEKIPSKEIASWSWTPITKKAFSHWFG